MLIVIVLQDGSSDCTGFYWATVHYRGYLFVDDEDAPSYYFVVCAH